MKDMKEGARMFLAIGRQAVGEIVKRGYEAAKGINALVTVVRHSQTTFEVVLTAEMHTRPLTTEHADGTTSIRVVRKSYGGIPGALELLLNARDQFVPFDPSEFDLVCPQAIDLEATSLSKLPAIVGFLPIVGAQLAVKESFEHARGLTRAASELLDSLREASYQHDVHRRLEEALKEGYRDSLAQPTPLNERRAARYLEQFECRILRREHLSDSRKRMGYVWVDGNDAIMARGLSWTDRDTPGEPWRRLVQIGRRRFSGEAAEHLALINARL